MSQFPSSARSAYSTLARATLLAGSAAATLAACTVGPNYVRPGAPLSAAFKEAPPGWVQSAPADAVDRGAWWAVFDDPVLDGLERRVAIGNQNLKAAEAAYRVAHATTEEARASFFPTLDLGAATQRSKSGTSRSVGGQIFNGGGSGPSTNNNYSTTLTASWAPDLWGSIRRTVEGDVANAQSQAATVASARLSYQAELATDYFDLRVLDAQKRLYDETAQAYQRALTLTENQYKVGVVARADVINAQSQLLSAQASAVDVGVQRGQFEHAIAVLAGAAPADVSVAPGALSGVVPVAPGIVPSELLQRRPDIASAERSVAAANAQIGVQTAAYYPSLNLSGDGGYSNSRLNQLFAAGAGFWSIAANASETLIDFGARRQRVREARFRRDQAVAQYRQTVLTALQGVEDQLVALRVLGAESGVRSDAERLARRSAQLAFNQYRAGQVDFATVVQAQTNALAAEQGVLNVLRGRLDASVLLIQNLGGGWTTGDLPPR